MLVFFDEMFLLGIRKLLFVRVKMIEIAEKYYRGL